MANIEESLDSWQNKVFLASQSILAADMTDDDDYYSFYNHMDNTSNQCITWLEACSCNEPRILLKWARILFYKVARTYMAAPLLLALLPLCVGLVVGIYGGRQWERKQENNKKNQSIVSEVQSGWLSWWFWLVQALSTHCLPLCWKQPNEHSMQVKENRVRADLKSDANTARESGVDIETVPKHVAVIMDGNRRYGKTKYGNVAKGHWDGSKTLVDFAKWCIAEGIQVLTCYAFSTENWNRSSAEVASLMNIFAKYCDELRVEALERNIRIHVLSTDVEQIPGHVKEGLRRMVEETKHCENGLTMNICLSYGSRGEIVNACRALALDARNGAISPQDIQERHVTDKLLTSHCADPDVVIRTSGEYRLSNFLLWQLAYSEMFFLPKQWPELEKSDLLEVIRSYSHGRRRRFGK